MGPRSSATVVEVRAHDEPGLLWRIGRALGECGLNVQAARVETLGAEAVDVFYVTDSPAACSPTPRPRRRNDSPRVLDCPNAKPSRAGR